MKFGTSGSERLRIDSSGRLLIGTTSTSPANSYSDNLVVSEAAANCGISIHGNNSNSNYASLYFGDAGAAQRSFLETQLGSNGNFTIGTTGTGPIRFTNSGGERLRIDSSGNVGIGVSPFTSGRVTAPHLVVGSGSNSPGLTLYGATNAQASLNFGDATSGTAAYDGGLRYAFGSGSPYLSFHVNGATERLRIDSSGRVGIGETNPSYKLHVKTGQVMFQETAAASNAVLRLKGSNTSKGGAIIAQSSNDGSAPLEFYSGTSQTMQIDSSGRLLVGTSSTSIATTAIFQGSSVSSSANADVKLSCDSTAPGNGGTLGILKFTDGTHVDGSRISAFRDGGTWSSSSKPTRLVFATASNGSASPTERLRIDSSGRVGIGGDPTYMLDVQGTDAALRLKGTASTGFIVDQNSSGFVSLINYNSAGLRFGTTSTERMRIASDGRIGINTSNPLEILHITGNPHAIIRAQASSSTAVSSLYFGDPSNAHSGYLQYAHNGDHLEIGTGGTEKMRLDSSGLLNIGTTVGNAGRPVHIHTAGSSSSYFHSTNSGTGSGAANGLLMGMGDSTDAYFWNYQNGFMQFATNNSAVMTLNASGSASFTGSVTADSYKTTANSVSALAINLSTGNYFTKTINGNSTFTFTNPPSSGTVGSFTLELTHTSGTVTWPSSVKFPADTAPTLTAGKTHLFVFVTDDGGSRYRGAALADYVN
jgi:hypothetical protein